MENRKHYAAALTAFITWGFFAIPLRALAGYSAGEILYFRIMFSALILIGIVFVVKRKEWKNSIALFKSKPKANRLRTVGLTLAGGALLSVNWLVFIYIVNNVNIKTASFSYLICPVLTAILGYVLIKEKLSVIQWVAVSLCIISCVLIGMQSSYELLLSFFTAITYALYLITQRVNQGFDRMVVLCIQVVFSFLLLSLFSSQLVQHIPQEGFFYGIIVIIAILFTVLPLFLNLYALNRINSATIGILMYINPLINFSLAFLYFHESLGTFQVLGYAVIAVALIVFNYPNFKKMRMQQSTSA